MARTNSNAFAITVVAPVVGLPTWLSSASVGQWVSVPNSTLSTFDSANLSPRPPGITGPISKVVAWCGGAIKRSGSVYMLGAAGGHGDYAGNEVQAIALNTNSPGWTMLRGPSATAVMYDDVPAYGDGRRAATHTYYNTQFDNAANRMFVMPAPGMFWSAGLPAAPSGYAFTDNNRPMAFSLSTNDWESFGTHTSWPGALGSDFTAGLCCSNALTGDIYFARSGDSGKFWRYAPGTRTWTQLTNIGHGNYAGSAIDHTRDRMLVVGDFSGTVAPRVYSLTGALQSVSFGGLGAGVLAMNSYPGVVYDETRDSFLVVRNTNPITVYEVNASTYAVSLFAMSGTVPAARTNGVHNAVQYVPELKGIVFHNNYSGPVQFMRTA